MLQLNFFSLLFISLFSDTVSNFMDQSQDLFLETATNETASQADTESLPDIPTSPQPRYFRSTHKCTYICNRT